MGTIEFERAGSVATIWLNRPAARNALCAAMLDELGSVVAALEVDESTRVAVIRGRGTAFSAGADLAELAAATVEQASEAARGWSTTLNRLAALPVPLIAAMHGFALGGGFLMALYCDLRLVAEGTRLGLPPASTLWIPPWALSRLAAWVGTARAEQFLLTAGVIDASEALASCLADRVVPSESFDAVVADTAARLSHAKRSVVAEVRRFFAQLRGSRHEDWDQTSTAGFLRCLASADVQEALGALRERFGNRTPSA